VGEGAAKQWMRVVAKAARHGGLWNRCGGECRSRRSRSPIGKFMAWYARLARGRQGVTARRCGSGCRTRFRGGAVVYDRGKRFGRALRPP